MDASFASAVDWSRPWLRPYRALGEVVAGADDWRAALNGLASQRGLRNHRDLPLRFVPQSELPPDLAYESFISDTGCVPTRENLHDFFNALVWLTFPTIKRGLNFLQAKAIDARRTGRGSPIGTGRGPLRDATTLFDENGALLITADAEMIEALRAHRWPAFFIERRADFHDRCSLTLFGHALLEKLVTPYKAITAHAWPLLADAGPPRSRDEGASALDARAALLLTDGLTSRDFAPLPILGVPGWSEGQGEAFYMDSTVFRPSRRGER